MNGCEKMYLMKYIAVALVFFSALLYAIRSVSSTSLSESRGKLCRAVLSLLALTLLCVVWNYSGEKYFHSAAIKHIARTVSTLLYVFYLPDIWADREAPAQGETKPDAPEMKTDGE